jgi:hypothetical protein
MSIDLRISDKPYIADILFKDGTTRRIDYSKMNLISGFFHFMASIDGAGLVTAINADTVAVVEVDEAAQTVGGTQ